MPTPFSFSLPLWTHIPSGTRGFLVSAFSSKWHAPGKVGCFMLSFYAAYGPTTAEWSLAACRTSSLAALLGARILSVVAQHPCRWWLLVAASCCPHTTRNLTYPLRALTSLSS